jgi:ATP-dependent Clp protease adapter protein ClpS
MKLDFQNAATKAPPRPRKTATPVIAADTDTINDGESFFQVVLHNDDHNEAGYVARCLMRVFAHEQTLAVKIMMEAHTKGKSIAEVEAESPAVKHKDQLRSLGLIATVEKVG